MASHKLTVSTGFLSSRYHWKCSCGRSSRSGGGYNTHAEALAAGQKHMS